MPEHLFVYGTLMGTIAVRGREAQAARRQLARGGRRIGPATIAGRLLIARGYPALVPCAGRSAVVRGEVWRLVDPAAIFRALDRYEGRDYVRRLQPVRAGWRQVAAWVYVWRRPGALRGGRLMPLLPGGDYAAWLQTGAKADEHRP